MQPNSTKRRRVDDASSTLSKPFKSPLRRQPVQPESPSNDPEDLKADEPRYFRGTHSTLVGSAPALSPRKVIDGTTELDSVKPKQNVEIPTQPRSPASSISRSPSANATAELAALRKQESVLLSRLVSLRRDLDTASQALKLEQTGQDEELKKLLGKWKGASREAAEELFVSAKDKVSRMGGVGAWKEKMRNARTRRWDDVNDTERKNYDNEESGDNGEGKERGRRDIDDQVDAEKVSTDGGEESEGDDDDTFTMDMMLKSLNIDLDAIGFDKANERWVD